MSTLDVADSPVEMEQMLNKAFKKITHLLEDIERMSNELQKKDSLLITLRSHFPALTSWLETSQASELAPQNTTSALRHAVLWEPSSSGRRPACSTPNRGTHWTEVVVRGRTRAPSGIHGGAPSTPSLQLSNKYGALSVSEKPAARDPHQWTPPVPVATDTMPPLTDTTAFPPLTASCPPAVGCPTWGSPPPPSCSSSKPKMECFLTVTRHLSTMRLLLAALRFSALMYIDHSITLLLLSMTFLNSYQLSTPLIAGF